ncbi:MAG TPA: hypothetical protein DDW76_09430 [Cyanobacteria bacterium UBA11369]|nr:hypothetical protein [Cyanobacteria bacterium UBA11371]HBE17652.1 hypothetical protein [Cyanobacteria bacterium UBA11367]HBE35613.1 hypothetical protein [Cyanobacteria bacterium UBA11368]HBE49001.1 hypothetical protein [Cyanobacteria bacterium UBA11369]
MDNLIVINLNDGSLAQGFSATLQIGNCGNYPSPVEAKLPPNPNLLEAYKDWQNIFRTYRYEKDTVEENPSVDERHLVEEKAKFLREHLNTWLNSELFIPVKYKLTEVFTSSEKVRVLVQTNDYNLWRLPWQEWNFFHDYPQAEIALSSPTSKSIKRCSLAGAKTKIRILYIQGDSTNIDTEPDIQSLESFLKDKADIEYLKLPKRKDLSKWLRHEKGWDIIFFAGHSRTDIQRTGRIKINEQESLSIPELKYALRTAIALGLKLAIFNSCDGLGLARDIADLQIPSVFVMREPVPDKVAQIFVKNFLEIFDQNGTLYASFQQARESLKTLEKDYPCASWLPVICQNPADEPITCDELLQRGKTETNWEGCCRTLLTIDALKRLNSNMLTQKKGLDIDDIYVSPNLGLIKRFKDKDSAQLTDQEKAQQKLEDGFPDTYKQEDFFIKVLQRGRSPYSQGCRIAIIGEAGTGKSLFLQRIGEWILWESDITNQLVIWVSLADLRKGQNLEDYLITNWLNNAKQQVNIPWTTQESLVTEFTSGRVMLLLDGADEMPIRSGNPLAEITRQIADSEWICQARIVLTCRVNVWEANQAILQNFDVYRNLEFSYQVKYGRTIDQVEAFIDGWFIGNDEQKKIGKALRQALEQEGKQQIKDLAKNPLRLSLLCLVWGEGGNLPDTKAELYQQFVEEIYKWKQTLLPVDDVKQKNLNKKLAELAKRTLDLRQQNFFKSLLIQIQEISQTPVPKSLLADMAQAGVEPQESPFRIPHILAWSILTSDLDLALNLGWLTPVGVSKNNPQARIYAFFHPIFHEYFAAQAIAFNEWNYFLTHDNSFTSHPAYGTYRVFEQQWREVILLWFGRPSEEVPNWCKERFIQTLWQFEDCCAGFYSFQAKFLAAAALAEFRNCNNEISEKIISKIVQYNFGNDLDKLSEDERRWFWLTHQSARKRAYIALSQTKGDQKVKDLLSQLLSSLPKEYIGYRSDIANALAQFNPGNQVAIDTHIDLMLNATGFDAKNYYDNLKISIASTERLWEIAHGNREAIKTLRRSLISNLSVQQDFKLEDLDDTIQKFVIMTLAIIASGSIAEKAIDKLIHMLSMASDDDILDFDESFYLVATENLDINVTHFLIDKLAKLLESPQNLYSDEQNKFTEERLENLQYIRLCVVTALLTIDTHHQDAANTLTKLLESDNERIYKTAAPKLERFGLENSVFIEVISKFIETTESKNALILAVEVLGKIAATSNNPNAIRALSNRLQRTTSVYMRLKIADNLGKVNPSDQTAIETLIEIVQSPEKIDKIGDQKLDFISVNRIRAEAAESLGQISPSHPVAVKTLIELQQIAVDTLIDLIQRLGTSNESISESFDEQRDRISKESPEWQIIEHACDVAYLLRKYIKNLEKIAFGSQEAVEALIKLLNFPNEDIVLRLAESLGEIDPSNQNAINTLITLYRTSQKESNRAEAANQLVYLSRQVTATKGNQFKQLFIDALTELIQTTDDEDLQRRVSETLGNIDVGNKLAVNTLVKLLKHNQKMHIYHPIQGLKKIVMDYQFKDLVIKLKDDDGLAKKDVARFQEEYELFWYCAENMRYQEFYKAFYRESSFSHLKPKLLLGRLVYLIRLGFYTFNHYYLSSYLKHPHYILFDIFSLIRLLLGYVYNIFIALGIPLFIIIIFIVARFNNNLRSDFIYIIELFWKSIAGIFYNSLPQIFRPIQIRRRKRQ